MSSLWENGAHPHRAVPVEENLRLQVTEVTVSGVCHRGGEFELDMPGEGQEGTED